MITAAASSIRSISHVNIQPRRNASRTEPEKINSPSNATLALVPSEPKGIRKFLV